MYCGTCGTEEAGDALFCGNCGNKFEETQSLEKGKIEESLMGSQKERKVRSTEQERPKVPALLNLVAIFHFLIGIFSILVGLLLFFFVPPFGLFAFLLGGIEISTAKQLFKFNQLARVYAAFIGAFAFIIGITIGEVFTIVTGGLSVYILVLDPNVSHCFRENQMNQN